MWILLCENNSSFIHRNAAVVKLNKVYKRYLFSFDFFICSKPLESSFLAIQPRFHALNLSYHGMNN